MGTRSNHHGKKQPKIMKWGSGITLTKKDMYDKDGKCILPQGRLPKRLIPRSKYQPK